MSEHIDVDFKLVEAIANHPYLNLWLTDEASKIIGKRLRPDDVRKTISEVMYGDDAHKLLLKIAREAIRQFSIEEAAEFDTLFAARIALQPTFERLLDNMVTERVANQVSPNIVTAILKEPVFNEQLQYRVINSAEDQFGKFRAKAVQALTLVSIFIVILGAFQFIGFKQVWDEIAAKRREITESVEKVDKLTRELDRNSASLLTESRVRLEASGKNLELAQHAAEDAKGKLLDAEKNSQQASDSYARLSNLTGTAQQELVRVQLGASRSLTEMQGEVQKVQRLTTEQTSLLGDAMQQSKAAAEKLTKAEESANNIVAELRKADPAEIIKAGSEARKAAKEASKAKLFRYTVVKVGLAQQIDIRDQSDPSKIYRLTLSLGRCQKTVFPLSVSAVALGTSSSLPKKTGRLFNVYSDPINIFELPGTSDRIWVEAETPVFHQIATNVVAVRIYLD